MRAAAYYDMLDLEDVLRGMSPQEDETLAEMLNKPGNKDRLARIMEKIPRSDQPELF